MATTTSSTSPAGGFLGLGWRNSSLSRTLNRSTPRVVVPASSLPSQQQAQAGTGAEVSTDGKRQTLFGPHIGGDDEEEEAMAAGAGGEGGGRPMESVSVETVKGWIERSKAQGENPHPTTTLQSLVNLKRPTLSLSPLPSSDNAPPSSSLHLLKFTYDASSPTVFVSIRLILPSPTATDPHLTVSEVVWAGQVSGGFGQLFTLPDDGAIDLGSATEHLFRMYEEEDAEEKKKASSLELEQEAATPAALESQAPRQASGRGGLMGGLFRGGRRESDVEAQSGVAMGAVGASAPAAASGASPAAEKKKEKKKSVRVVIRLEARGENGETMPNLNAQQTHLEITHSRGRSGTTNTLSAPPIAAAITEETPAVPGQESVAQGVVVVEGRRSTWSAKVIRREALIGSHTFHLREIFGLTSSTTNPTSQSNPASYPPQADDDPYASTPNECIICLVSPRDVVLLPCRHLVVCKECAIGMVEFGAGGKVMRREGEGEFGASEATAAGETAEGGVAAADAPTPVVATPAPTTGRRKKKAKGWQCPVCRLPYTSMLRVALPTSKPGLETSMAASSIHDHDHGHSHDIKKDSDNVSHNENTGYPPRSSSPVPTLPGRAESILLPDGPEDDEDDIVAAHAGGDERPQFVLGAEVDTAEDEETRRRRVEKSA